ncbi:Glycosyltransferase involved in cell wall bisynthesis [Rosenbergiella nectarea]|uniref:Glycosyltransferase involved in cell wall bisynthesis n=1 Tax=Rosenbergiella nectarea TaxID=988801 RepID=A0A1H9DAQ2_9GAMM|nr:glycosyltransferase family 4 protein [Rosenbergiella nectarea]SEQ10429.1 Glycosyltransferase involved in cell wall bisynthesis [Rosenbergiella nectarea]
MKIICYFINSDWYFDLHWLERALASKRHNYQVHIIARFTEQDFLDKFSKLGFICHPISLKERAMNPFGFLSSSVSIFQILNQIKPDILHSITIKPILLGGIYAKNSSCSFVANIVGLGRVFDSKGIIFSILKKITLGIYKFILSNNNSRFIFEHEEDKNILKEYLKFKNDQFVVIDGAGVDTTLFSYQCENKNIVPVVFFAGRMLKNKGLNTLVKLRRELKKDNVNFNLVVAGIEVNDDPQAIPSHLLKEWCENGDIVWLGMRKDIHQLIAESNIIALPTTYPEGVPRILIEASAIGRACIAYDSGGCKSIVKDRVTGYLVEKNNYALLKEKMISLINSYELRVNMGINGRKLVIDRFSSNKVINKTLEIYNQLL